MSLVPSQIDEAGVLQALGLNPRDSKVQALALVAERYGLDLILKQVFLIQGTVYVSHAGLLSIAHRSGDLDGIEVEVEEEPTKFVATAKIYRKSMSRPFVYTDECYKNEQAVKDKRKRAITRAERNALRRAFDVGVDVYEDDRPEPPIVLSNARPEIPRRTLPPAGAQPAGEGPGTPGLEVPEKESRTSHPPPLAYKRTQVAFPSSPGDRWSSSAGRWGWRTTRGVPWSGGSRRPQRVREGPDGQRDRCLPHHSAPPVDHRGEVMAYIRSIDVDIVQPSYEREPCKDRHLVKGTAKWRRCVKCYALLFLPEDNHEDWSPGDTQPYRGRR